MSEKATIAWGLGKILLQNVSDWFSSRVVLTTLTAVFVVVPHALADESVRRITLEQALQMFEENSLELRLVSARAQMAAANASIRLSHDLHGAGCDVDGRLQAAIRWI